MRWQQAMCASMLGAAALAAGMGALPAQAQQAPFWSTPTIQGYGKIHYLPHAAYRPDAAATYKIVFAITAAPRNANMVNLALDHVARTVNLYVAAGVPLDHLKFVAIAYGPATALALDNAHYRALYHVPNPNLQLIAELRQAGVDVAVCGQAVAEHHFHYRWLAHNVTLALSALTTVTGLQQQGYALMQM